MKIVFRMAVYVNVNRIVGVRAWNVNTLSANEPA